MARSKTDRSAARAKNYQPRLPMSPKTQDADERQKKCSFLLNVLNSRNEIGDPSRKKENTAVSY